MSLEPAIPKKLFYYTEVLQCKLLSPDRKKKKISLRLFILIYFLPVLLYLIFSDMAHSDKQK